MIQPTNAQQLYPQPGGANAVSINIYNPTAYGSAQQPIQQAPYAYTNSLYGMPQASLYENQNNAMVSPMYVPAYNPVMMQPYNATQGATIAPPPEVMPQSVMMQQNYQPTEMVQQPQAQAQEVQQPQAQVVEQNTQEAPIVDTNELVNGLMSSDPAIKEQTINKVAALVQDVPAVAYQLVSEPIMNSLINIINEDTSNLQGPSAEQIAAVEKLSKGETLTPEENTLVETLSPRDLANKNRIFSLYTLAMIQKLQRDELNQYIENQKANGEQPIEPIALSELNGYNEIVNIINNNDRPEVKVAAIQALQHIAAPEEKAQVEKILANALNSDDADIKTAAQEAMQNFAA